MFQGTTRTTLTRVGLQTELGIGKWRKVCRLVGNSVHIVDNKDGLHLKALPHVNVIRTHLLSSSDSLILALRSQQFSVFDCTTDSRQDRRDGVLNIHNEPCIIGPLIAILEMFVSDGLSFMKVFEYSPT